ncbi:nucleotidyltransferase [Butyrivibrio sp. VCD2006]|uniref:nucleotidyltransferase n=1 Tax=Butyrivibrio sp. VCD2006 TaxID=1280664 RepID=UPI00040A3C7A|nr:nucleotidyltransferase [Butyrivibrio sp. VCD2006]
MKTVGIIAEFNPFHKGHEYLIRTLKKETGSDYAVIVMSGDYTQRGAPAIFDKYTRTKMALLSGADLVLELPIYYSTSSAEFFAGGAISILNGLSCVDYLGFGSESGDLKSMQKIAGILAEEPSDFSTILKESLKSGKSYAAARSAALSSFAGTNSSIISNPNDILGTEYIRALLLQGSNIEPISIKRIGAGYNDDTLSNDSDAFSSAKAIRSALESCEDVTSDLDTIMSKLPIEVYKLMARMNSQGNLQTTSCDDFSELLHYKLLSEKSSGFDKYLDVSPDLSDKIIRRLSEYTTFSEFVMKLKSKDLTYARISRALLHILLNMTSEKMNIYTNDRKNFLSYARILGFNKSASPLMKKIQECSRIPVISKLSDSYKALDADSYMLLSETIAASNIYDLIRGADIINEYAKQVIISSDTCTPQG